MHAYGSVPFVMLLRYKRLIEESFSLATFSFKAGFKSLINNAEAYETLIHYSKFFLFYNMRCFVMFVTAVCMLFLLKLARIDNQRAT